MTESYYFAAHRRPTTPTEPGSRYAKTYHMELDPNGHKVLIEDGLTDTYEVIQSHLESTKIETILARAAMGDESGLYAKNPQFLDFRDVPQSLAEAQNLIIKMEHEFERLPLEVRKKFDHSAERFVATYGTTEWQDAMTLGNPNGTPADGAASSAPDSAPSGADAK